MKAAEHAPSCASRKPGAVEALACSCGLEDARNHARIPITGDALAYSWNAEDISARKAFERAEQHPHGDPERAAGPYFFRQETIERMARRNGVWTEFKARLERLGHSTAFLEDRYGTELADAQREMGLDLDCSDK